MAGDDDAVLGPGEGKVRKGLKALLAEAPHVLVPSLPLDVEDGRRPELWRDARQGRGHPSLREGDRVDVRRDLLEATQESDAFAAEDLETPFVSSVRQCMTPGSPTESLVDRRRRARGLSNGGNLGSDVERPPPGSARELPGTRVSSVSTNGTLSRRRVSHAGEDAILEREDARLDSAPQVRSDENGRRVAAAAVAPEERRVRGRHATRTGLEGRPEPATVALRCLWSGAGPTAGGPGPRGRTTVPTSLPRATSPR